MYVSCSNLPNALKNSSDILLCNVVVWFFLASRDSACLSLLWGGRVVERKQKKAYPNTSDWCNTEDWEAFMGIFEGGGVLYCHMAFEDLLYMRGRLEELGFPCKSVADSLWLQVTFVYMCRQMNGSSELTWDHI